MCSLLLSHGADPTLVNCHNKSALDLSPTADLREKLLYEYRLALTNLPSFGFALTKLPYFSFDCLEKTWLWKFYYATLLSYHSAPAPNQPLSIDLTEVIHCWKRRVRPMSLKLKSFFARKLSTSKILTREIRHFTAFPPRLIQKGILIMTILKKRHSFWYVITSPDVCKEILFTMFLRLESITDIYID